jgi:hypothetical protein
MKTLHLFLFAFAASSLLFSTTASPKGGPEKSCPCLLEWTNMAAELGNGGCIDTVARSKNSLGKGDFISILYWAVNGGSCGVMKSDGFESVCHTDIGVSSESGNCLAEPGIPKALGSKPEQRDCIAAQREISRILDKLSGCS